MAEKSAAKETGGRKKAARRELVNTGIDERFVRPGAHGRFKESDALGEGARCRPAQEGEDELKNGQKDRGDR